MLKDFVVPGSFGRFQYELHGDSCSITLPIAIDFVDGDALENPGFSDSGYQWTQQQRQGILQQLEQQLKEVWEGKFSLVGTPIPGTHDQARTYELQFKLVEHNGNHDVSETKKTWQILLKKDPQNVPSVRAHVCRPGNRHFGTTCPTNPDQKYWGSVVFSSSDLEKQGNGAGWQETYKLRFQSGTSMPEPDYAGDWNRFLYNYTGSGDHYFFNVIGCTSPEEIGSNERHVFGETHSALALAENRAIAAEQLILKHSIRSNQIFTRIASPFRHDDVYSDVQCSTSIIEVYAEPQSIVAHEFGHCFGLLDEYAEYPEDEGKPLPTNITTDLIRYWGFHVPLFGSTRSIMSNGNSTYSRHFTPFLELMRRDQPQFDWSLQPN